ncbi:TLDc domain-containing protein [Entamoeba marina]
MQDFARLDNHPTPFTINSSSGTHTPKNPSILLQTPLNSQPTWFLDNYVDSIEKWSKLKYSHIVIDSDDVAINSDSLFDSIHDQKNLAFIIQNHDNIFGSFHSVTPRQRGITSPDDPSHFVFSLKNSYGLKPTMYTKKKKSGSLRIFRLDESENGVFDVYGFGVFGKSLGSISNYFPTLYEDHNTTGGRIFVGDIKPSQFEITRIVVLQLVEPKEQE